jgi:hypothetical protein
MSGILKWNHDFLSIYSSIVIILPQLIRHPAPTMFLTPLFNRLPEPTICPLLYLIPITDVWNTPKAPMLSLHLHKNLYTSSSAHTWPFITPISTTTFLGTETENNLTQAQHLFYDTCELLILVAWAEFFEGSESGYAGGQHGCALLSKFQGTCKEASLLSGATIRSIYLFFET